MKSVEHLMAEHELIERGLVLLDKAVARIDAGQPLPEGFPAWAARFFQQFADKCHHAKEEDVFFPVLKQRGIPEQGGPIGVMLHEHVLGRDCVGRMLEASQMLNSENYISRPCCLIRECYQTSISCNSIFSKLSKALDFLFGVSPSLPAGALRWSASRRLASRYAADAWPVQCRQLQQP